MTSATLVVFVRYTPLDDVVFLLHASILALEQRNFVVQVGLLG
jgi:hypothetical protein